MYRRTARSTISRISVGFIVGGFIFWAEIFICGAGFNIFAGALHRKCSTGEFFTFLTFLIFCCTWILWKASLGGWLPFFTAIWIHFEVSMSTCFFGWRLLFWHHALFGTLLKYNFCSDGRFSIKQRWEVIPRSSRQRQFIHFYIYLHRPWRIRQTPAHGRHSHDESYKKDSKGDYGLHRFAFWWAKLVLSRVAKAVTKAVSRNVGIFLVPRANQRFWNITPQLSLAFSLLRISRENMEGCVFFPQSSEPCRSVCALWPSGSFSHRFSIHQYLSLFRGQ